MKKIIACILSLAMVFSIILPQIESKTIVNADEESKYILLGNTISVIGGEEIFFNAESVGAYTLKIKSNTSNTIRVYLEKYSSGADPGWYWIDYEDFQSTFYSEYLIDAEFNFYLESVDTYRLRFDSYPEEKSECEVTMEKSNKAGIYDGLKYKV